MYEFRSGTVERSPQLRGENLHGNHSTRARCSVCRVPRRPKMIQVNFYIPAPLKNQVAAEARRQEMDFSEYVRQTLVIRMAWTAAIRAVQSGAEPDELLDPWGMFTKFQAITEAATEGQNEKLPATESGEPRRSKKD